MPHPYKLYAIIYDLNRKLSLTPSGHKKINQGNFLNNDNVRSSV